MDNLFNKAAMCTDVHFGRGSNNPQNNQDNLDFFKWFIEEAKTWGAETCIMLGDWHDSRNSLNISTMDYSLAAMEMLNDAFKQVLWITGNHDLYYRHKRSVSSVAFGKHLPNIQIVNEPFTAGDVTILPWLVGDEHKMVRSLKSRYVFGHLELPGYLMNAKVPMPVHGDGISDDDFKNGPEYVFSGHFHFRQARNNIVYIGNIMPFNFADVDDPDRGACFLEWGKEPFFRAWPDQPLFKTFKLSELLDHSDKLLCDKLTARVTLDIDISYEEAQVIKDTFLDGTGVRRLELIHPPRFKVDEQQFREGDMTVHSVDQIVTEGLLSVESKGYDAKKLADIYRALPHV